MGPIEGITGQGLDVSPCLSTRMLWHEYLAQTDSSEHRPSWVSEAWQLSGGELVNHVIPGTAAISAYGTVGCNSSNSTGLIYKLRTEPHLNSWGANAPLYIHCQS
jgi:hypothetical protein